MEQTAKKIDLSIALNSKISKNSDLLIIGFLDNAQSKWVNTYISYTKADIARLEKSEIFKADERQEYLWIGQDNHPSCLLVGLGQTQKYNLEKFRNSLARAIKKSSKHFHHITLILESFLPPSADLEAVIYESVQCALLAVYNFDQYKSKKKSVKKLVLEIFHPHISASHKSILTKARGVAEAINLVRNLGNEPANVLTPEALMKYGKQVAHDIHARFEVMNQKQLTKLKMGGILAVGQGSIHPPYLFVIDKKSKHPKAKTIVLVGKGVTFDTGGISIKPASSMADMKFDMCGAAVVVGVMKALGTFATHHHVVGIVPTVENNIGANPQRPGDIIRTYSGKTVEVLNTDAEGRLILADALAYAKNFKPDIIIDLATLTGAIVGILADKAAGIMSTDDQLTLQLIESGEKTGERLWRLPLWEEFEESIKSKNADIQNIGGRYAGAITAGLFLKHFVPEKTVWAHLDIAGVSWSLKGRDYVPHGASGFGVRLLLNFISQL